MTFKVFDDAFDPDSFLVSVPGIPEPKALALLGLGVLPAVSRRG